MALPETAAVLDRTCKKLSSQVVEDVIRRAGFGTEFDPLRTLLADISSAAAKIAVRLPALRSWLGEVEAACSTCDRFVDSVREFRPRSRAVIKFCARSASGVDGELWPVRKKDDIGRNLNKLVYIFQKLFERPQFRHACYDETRPDREILLRKPDSASSESEILGRDEDRERIWRIIFAGQSDGLHFVLISGEDGSGKTTLARLAYNDSRVEEFFDCRMWVAMPENFDIELIAMKIIKCATRSANPTLSLGSVDELSGYLQRVLRGRKFFLVLDDVSGISREEWRRLRSLLSVGEGGSTVIVTALPEHIMIIMTHHNRLIEFADPREPEVDRYKLEPLPEDVCFDLLVKKAFGTEKKVDLTAFSAIGKQIVGKCLGLPLAISMIGGMLRCRPENDVDRLLESLNPYRKGYEGLLKALIKFSYQTLPWHLQLCILYLRLFPNHYTFDKHEIIDLWNAECFIPCVHRGDTIEYYGDHCIDILVSLYFLQELQHPDGQGNLKYRIYSQLYFTWEYAGEGVVFVKRRANGLYDLPEGICHLSLLCDEETKTLPQALFQQNNLQTLLLLREGKIDELNQKIRIEPISDEFFSYLKNLYVLDLHSCAISELPNSIERLSCLRYLNLSETDVKTIPESIANLQELQILNLSYCKELCTLHPSITKLENLETLNLKGCRKLDFLPDDMCNLINLRHLNILECSSLTRMPRQIGKLSDLQTLSRYIATAEGGRTIGELQGLANLKGALRIENLENVLDPADAERAHLNSKGNVTSLALHWSWSDFYNDDSEPSGITAQQVLEALQPPPCLEILEIISYPGTGAPQWMTNGQSTLESMVEIRLVNLKRLKNLPPLGLFPCLRVIEIRGMDAVTCVDDTFCGNDGVFTKLEMLTFSQMPNLEKWVSEDNQNKFPHLTDLTIAHCPKLKELPFSCSSLTNLMLLLNNEMLYRTPGALKCFSQSLRKLTIGLCDELVETSIWELLHDLTALEELEVSECDQLISLPQGMCHLTSLRHLIILNCTNLVTLPDWPRNSASKPKLSISGCPKLRHQI